MVSPSKQTAPASDPERCSLEKEASHTLEEARMVLPGVQALFGFQLIAVFQQSFASLLSQLEQRLHLASIVFTAMAIALLMTPAAYHRQAEPHDISRRFLRLSSYMLTVGMFTLFLSLEIDCYLISRIVLKRFAASFIVADALGVLYLGLWFVLPHWQRRKHLNMPIHSQS